LTKATYDAIGNKFRALWGKEAGWAHSVLFTADLKTFSERLVAKVEIVSEETTIKDEGGVVTMKEETVETKVTAKRIKCEADDEDDKLLVQASEQAVKRTKRRRKL
jgi:N-glycosylase/DNA lyase